MAATMPAGSTFSAQDRDILSRLWHPVAYSHEVQGRPIGARLLDEALVVYRTSQGVVVARDLCLHRGAALTLGRQEGDELICAYHGFRYGPDGSCLSIPAHPGGGISAKIRLMTYASVERYGLVWVRLAEEGSEDLPDWSEAEDPAYRRVPLDPDTWQTSAARMVENFLDVAHFSFVHDGTFGNPAHPEVPAYTVEPRPNGFHYEYDYLAVNPESSPLADDRVASRHMVYDVTFPFAVRMAIEYPGGRRHVIFNTAAPVSAKEVRIFFFVARNFDHDLPAEQVVKWERAILAQDRIVVESQRPEELPLDLSEEFHIKADAAAITYRRGLGALGLGPILAA